MVFKVDTTGNETVLHSFTGTGGDGMSPEAGLLRDAKGNLYGNTGEGGNLSCTTGPGGNGQTLYGCGTVFKLTPAKLTKTTTTLTSVAESVQLRTGSDLHRGSHSKLVRRRTEKPSHS